MDNNSEYISLQEAAKYCSYSQEYLALRTRQGKLKAVKFGRNWVTKKEWLEEYLQKVEEYNNNLITQKVVAPPRNLPIEKPVPLVRFGFVVALAFILLATGIVFGKESFKNVYRDIEPYTYIVGGAGDIIVENVVEVLADTISDIPQSFATISLATVSIGDTFKEYGQWIGKIFGEIPRSLTQSYINANDFLEKEITGDIDDLVRGISVIRGRASISWQEIVNGTIKGYVRTNDFVEEKISQGYRAVTQFRRAPEKIVEEELAPKPAGERLVIIPSTGEDEELEKKIKEAFSDEVIVEPKNETFGIIKPVFKEDKEQEYFYILLPIKN